jgi:hypothetical protein
MPVLQVFSIARQWRIEYPGALYHDKNGYEIMRFFFGLKSDTDIFNVPSPP